jgi:hypothetical protein
MTARKFRSYEIDLEKSLRVPEEERTEEMYARMECFSALWYICIGSCCSFMCGWVLFIMFFGTSWLFKLFKEADKAATWKA